MSGCRSESSESGSVRLQERDQRLLVDLFLQRVLTRDQIIGLGHFCSVPRCNDRLRKLLCSGLVRKYRQDTRIGSQTLYGVGPRSGPTIGPRLEIDIDEIQNVIRREVAPLALEHTLLLTDLRIQFEREFGDKGDWLAEPLCRHEYSIRHQSNWLRRVLKPDAYCAQRSEHLFIELDLGHVGHKPFLRKVNQYAEYLRLGIFSEAYQDESFRVLVITVGMRRLAHLRALTKHVSAPEFVFTTLGTVAAAGFESALCSDKQSQGTSLIGAG